MVLSGLTFQRRVTRAALTLLSLAVCIGARAQSSNVTGTMPEHYLPELNTILLTALRRSPQVIKAEFEVEVREANRYRDDAARWPSVGGYLSYASNQEAVSSNTSTQSRASGFFYSFSLSQSLFHWNALKNATAASKINLLIAQRSYDDAYRALSVSLRQSYLDLIIKKARLRYGRYSFKLAEADLALLKDNAARGLASPAAVGGRELDLREAKLELDRTEAEFAGNLRRFARVAGLNVAEFTEAAIPDELPRPTFAPELAAGITASLLRDRARDAYEPQVLALRIREADLRYRIESVRLYPKFNAGAGYSLENNSTADANRVHQQATQRENVNVTAQWNIFDGYATRAAKMEARASKRFYERQLAATVESVLEQAQMLERTLKLDAERLEIADTRHAIALAGKQRITEESALGNLPKGDVERAQTSVIQSEANAFVARAQFFADWSEFVSLAGLDPVLNNLPAHHDREKR